MKVVHISEVKQDNRLISPAEMMRYTADEIDAGERKIVQKAIIILLNTDTPDGKACFDTTCCLAQMRVSEAVAALACVKDEFCRMLNKE